MRGWDKSELEKLLGWMEDNQELLRGSTAHWTRRVKETVFTDDEHIDVKKIKAKYHNMRRGWKAAKEIQEQSGFGLGEDECTSSVNGRILQFFANSEASAANLALLEVLNKKCGYFWKLDEIFGARPNNNPAVTSDTLSQRVQLPSPWQTPSQLPSDSLILSPNDWPENDPEQQHNFSASREVDEDAVDDSNSSDDLPAASTPVPSAGTSTSTRLKRKSSISGRGNRRRGNGDLTRLPELNRNDWAEREEKRLKMQADTQLQIARIQAESQERILEIQMRRDKERDERQLQMFQSLMDSVIQIVNSTGSRSNHINNGSS
jgi:hypothetical protein